MPIDYVQIVKLHLTLPRLVGCGYCQTEYVYHMTCEKEVQASILKRGAESAKDDAYAAAEKLVQEHFENRCDPVPCPKCYIFQRDMSREAGMARYQWILVFLVPTLLMAGFGFTIALFGDGSSQRLIALAVAVAGIVGLWMTIIIQNRLIERFDANTKSEDLRQGIAAERAVLLEDFHRDQAENAKREYREHNSSQKQTGSDESPIPFVLDVWLKEEQLKSGSSVPLPLPSGGITQLDIDKTADSGSLHSLYATDGSELPIIARVCFFNRTPSNL